LDKIKRIGNIKLPGYVLCRDFCFNLSRTKNRTMAVKEMQLPAMSKGWNIVEKTIAVLLALASLFVLYNEVSIVAGILGENSVVKTSATYNQLFKTHHLPIIVSILGLFGGCMMLFNDKKGWMMSLIATAMFCILFYLSSRSNSTDKTLPFASFYKSYGITSIICFVLFLLLLWKPLRTKYRPTSKNWMWLAGIVILLIIDKMIF